MPRNRLLLALLPLAALACASAIAAPSPPHPAASAETEPVHVRADKLEVDLDGKSATLQGKVELRRSDLVLRCPSLEARFDSRPSVVWAHAHGGVTVEAAGSVAEADEATVDLEKRSVELRGGVVLRRGASTLRASEARLDLASRKVALTAVSGAIALPSAPSSPPASPPALPSASPPASSGN